MHKAITFAALTMALASAPALGHHSFAMFDHGKVNKLSGMVKEFEYINPHAWLHLAVADASGRMVTWSFEMGGVGQLVRDGWNRNSVAVGDSVEVSFHPLKDGSNGGQFLAIVYPDGRVLCQGGAGAEPCDPAAVTSPDFVHPNLSNF